MPTQHCSICNKEFNTSGLFRHMLLEQKISEYNTSPNICRCGGVKDYKHRNAKYCSASCAASMTNAIRPAPSEATKLKTSSSLLLKNSTKLKTVTKIGFCAFCGKCFEGSRKTCSDECFKSFQSKKQTDTLKYKHKHSLFPVNYNGPSWMERTFSELLKATAIKFESEVKVHNTNLDKYYYLDFILQEYNTVIELDGNQHKNSVDADRIRDAYLVSIGYSVIRIQHSDYKKLYFSNTLLSHITDRLP